MAKNPGYTGANHFNSLLSDNRVAQNYCFFIVKQYLFCQTIFVFNCSPLVSKVECLGLRVDPLDVLRSKSRHTSRTHERNQFLFFGLHRRLMCHSDLGLTVVRDVFLKCVIQSGVES